MSDRTVRYLLQAELGAFKAQMAQASAAVKHSADQMTAATKQGVAFRSGLTELGSTAGKVGLVAAAGLGVAVLSAAKFDEAMAHVQAATHETAANMGLLREAALEAGARTVFSATEAAGAIEELAKAGVTTKDILGGGLNAALDLAAAGTIDVGTAAEIAATTMNQFGLAGSEAGRAADVLAAAAGKAQGEVGDIAEALKYVGPVAHQMGVSLEEAGGSIAYLATQGIQGEQAGTGLRGMLLSLTSPSAAAAEEMESLGINMYNAQGHFIGLDGVAGQLQSSMSNLTEAERDQALGRIFGNAQVTTARILYAGGADAIRSWTNAVDDSGYASETAAMKLDSLMGDLEQLGGALQTAFIGVGSQDQGGLRSLVQGLTDVVNIFNKLPDSAQGATGSLLGVTAVIGGGAWFASKAIVGVSNMRKALDDLGPAGTKAAAGLRAVSIVAAAGMGLDIAVSALAELNRELDKSAPNIFVLRSNLRDLASGGDLRPVIEDVGDLQAAIESVSDPTMFKAITDFYDKIPVFGSVLPNLLEIAPVSGDQLQQLREAEASLSALDEALAGLAASDGPKAAKQAFRELADSYQLTATEQERLISLLPTAQAFLDGIGGAAHEAGTGANFFGDTAQRLGGILSGLTGDTDQDTGATKSNAAAHRDAAKALSEERAQRIRNASAVINYEASIDDATKSLKDNGRTLDVTTEKGRANRTALLNMAAAWNDQSTAVRSNKREQQDAIGTFVRVATQMGMNEDAARRYAERLFDIPPKRETQIILGGVERSLAGLAALKARMDAIQSKTVYVNVRSQGGPQAAPMATGGPVVGPGTGTSDDVPAWLSNGEYVIKAAAVERYGRGFFDRANAMRLASGGSISTYARTRGAGSSIGDDLGAAADALRGLAHATDASSQSLAQQLKERVKEATQRRDAFAEEMSERKEHLQALRQERQAIVDSVAARFGDSPFGDSGEFPEWFTEEERARLEVLRNQNAIRSDIADARELRGYIRELRHKGFTGAALADLAANEDLSTIAAYADMSQRDLRAFERSYNLRSQLANRAGRDVGDAVLGRAMNQQSALVQRGNEHLRDLNQGVKQLEKRLAKVEKAAGVDGPDRAAKGFADALDHKAGGAKRKAGVK